MCNSEYKRLEFIINCLRLILFERVGGCKQTAFLNFLWFDPSKKQSPLCHWVSDNLEYQPFLRNKRERVFIVVRFPFLRFPRPRPRNSCYSSYGIMGRGHSRPRAHRFLVTWLETGRLQIKPSGSGDENGSWLTEVALYFPMDKTRRLPSNSENKPLNVY